MKEIIAVDITLDQVTPPIETYYRLPEGLKQFLEKCLEKHNIVGFKWEEGSWNFGVLLTEKPESLTTPKQGE